MNATIDLKNICIETDRLILGQWKETDLNDFFEYASVDGVGQMAGWQPHKSLEESAAILKMFIEERKTFAVVLKESNKVIGSVGIEKLSTEIDGYENMTGREIGYVLNKDYWGQGLMPEAVKAVTGYCFETAGCDYLLCSCSPENRQSARVMEKCGFRFISEKIRKLSDGSTRAARYHILDNPDKK